jgi:hypothetical protein
VLIPDTSVLWHEDKTYPINPTFDTFWDDHESLVTLELIIPDAVRQELLFQQTCSAHKAFDHIAEKLTLISGITGKSHKHRTSKEMLRSQITERLDRWIRGKNAVVQPTPTERIKWAALCEAALWKQPPFTFDVKNPNFEKGFRDALVLETVVDFAAGCNRDVNIAFVCHDNLLRETANKRLASDARCSCYENLQDFSSYIKLTREKLTNEFIKSILRRARNKFFSNGDPECLYLSARIREQIIEFVRADFENPTAHEEPSLRFPSFLSIPLWKQVGATRRWISAPKFERVVNDAEYYWKTVITSVGQFQDSKSATPESSRRILTVQTAVLWHSRVLSDGRFRSLAFDGLEPGSGSFRIPTDEDIKLFELQPATLEQT